MKTQLSTWRKQCEDNSRLKIQCVWHIDTYTIVVMMPYAPISETGILINDLLTYIGLCCGQHWFNVLPCQLSSFINDCVALKHTIFHQEISNFAKFCAKFACTIMSSGNWIFLPSNIEKPKFILTLDVSTGKQQRQSCISLAWGTNTTNRAQ